MSTGGSCILVNREPTGHRWYLGTRHLGRRQASGYTIDQCRSCCLKHACLEGDPDADVFHQRDAKVVGSLLGLVDPSIRALSGRLKLTVRRHYFN